MDHARLQTELQKSLYRLGRANMEDFGSITKLEAFTLGLLRKGQVEHPEAKGMYISELVRRSHGSPPAISRTLRQLEQKGYLERVVDRADRRMTYVVLTAQGLAALDEAWERSRVQVSRVLDRMGEDNVNALIQQLNQLTDIILDEQEKERTQC